jgi:NCS1 family nucleobase:cation symporter-1
MPSRVDDSIELAPVIASSSTSRARTRRNFEGAEDHEPLLSTTSAPSLAPDPDDHSPGTPTSPAEPIYFSPSPLHSFFSRRFHFYKAIMEKTRSSKFRHYARKLAVESEPGLTNAQLMLTNHDLKPGMISCVETSV